MDIKVGGKRVPKGTFTRWWWHNRAWGCQWHQVSNLWADSVSFSRWGKVAAWDGSCSASIETGCVDTAVSERRGPGQTSSPRVQDPGRISLPPPRLQLLLQVSPPHLSLKPPGAPCWNRTGSLPLAHISKSRPRTFVDGGFCLPSNDSFET